MRVLKPRYLSVIVAAFFVIFFAFAVDILANFPSKIIYLTFDADMTAKMQAEQKSGLVKRWYDPALIEYLERNNIAATFFMTGMFAEMYPALAKGIGANPNFSIQNHTYSHRAFEPHCFHLPFLSSDQEKKAEIRKTQDILKSLAGYTPVYFRYPGLCHNAHDDSLVAAEGLLLAKGEVSSGDAYLKKPAAIADHVLGNLSRGRVIVFHMGTIKSPATTDAVKLLVPKLKNLGYTLERL